MGSKIVSRTRRQSLDTVLLPDENDRWRRCRAVPPQVTVPARKSSRLMPWLVSGAAGVALGLGAGWLVFAPTPADAEVAALIDDYIAAWDAGDGAAAVSLMTEDGVHYSADAQQGKAANDDGALGLAAFVERIGWATLEPVGDPIISEGPPYEAARHRPAHLPRRAGIVRGRRQLHHRRRRRWCAQDRRRQLRVRRQRLNQRSNHPSGCSSRGGCGTPRPLGSQQGQAPSSSHSPHPDSTRRTPPPVDRAPSGNHPTSAVASEVRLSPGFRS